MSRSIHATRHAWWELGTWQFSDPTEQIEVRAELAREKIKKRRIKRQVIRERGSVDERAYRIADVSSIPLEIFDTGPFLHYPASIADLRVVLELLPAGVTDGLMGIELRSGRSEQTDEAARCSCVPDPFTGRVGTQVLPGVFSGHILGTYMPRTARIHLFAYVYEPALPDREMWELLLRGHMLGTLAHEVAHHHDHARRTGRGRWLAESSHSERYAEEWESAWGTTFRQIGQYLRQAYPQATQALVRWVTTTTEEQFDTWKRAFGAENSAPRETAWIRSILRQLIERVEGGHRASC